MLCIQQRLLQRSSIHVVRASGAASDALRLHLLLDRQSTRSRCCSRGASMLSSVRMCTLLVAASASQIAPDPHTDERSEIKRNNDNDTTA